MTNVDKIDFDDMLLTEENENYEDAEHPNITDIGWTEHVLSLLDQEKEIFNGRPTTDGLRRITPLLLGEIIEDTTKVVQCPTIDNEYRATVVCDITIYYKHQPITFSGAADVYSGNTQQDIFAKRPVATAETRAEGRALRKALRLRQIIVAEEDEEIITPQTITENDVMSINTVCQKTNINVIKFINSGSLTYNDITEIPSDKVYNMLAVLNTYQQNPDKIPENIKGYIEDWRNNNETSA